jgi:hypothetical protein
MEEHTPALSAGMMVSGDVSNCRLDALVHVIVGPDADVGQVLNKKSISIYKTLGTRFQLSTEGYKALGVVEEYSEVNATIDQNRDLEGTQPFRHCLSHSAKAATRLVIYSPCLLHTCPPKWRPTISLNSHISSRGGVSMLSKKNGRL